MTILTSLLIATQGLLPNPQPLTIGTQGLLRPGAPVVKPTDLPGGGGGRREKEVVTVIIRGVTARLTSSNDVEVRISAKVNASGMRARTRATAPAQVVSASFEVGGNVQGIAASRLKPQISTSFEVIGCAEDDMALVRLMAHAALEEYYLQSMIDAYDD